LLTLGAALEEKTMDGNFGYVLAVAIGFVAGLRSLTAPAVVSWAAYMGTLNLQGSRLQFMGSIWAAVIFTVLALAEFVGDILPKTPSRTKPGPLGARIVMGALCGACLCAAAQLSPAIGAILGGIGGVIGAFAGYQARMRLVRALGVKDIYVAFTEDLVAIGLACLIVSLA
jgi:uncharacterized membrane protein